MIIGIEHVAIVAKNVTDLKDWYVKMFGFDTVYDNGKGTYFLKASQGSMIEIFGAEENGAITGPKGSGLRHIALTVAEVEFDLMVTKLKNAKVEVVTDAATALNGVKTFFFRDPEGNILHLIYRPQPLG